VLDCISSFNLDAFVVSTTGRGLQFLLYYLCPIKTKQVCSQAGGGGGGAPGGGAPPPGGQAQGNVPIVPAASDIRAAFSELVFCNCGYFVMCARTLVGFDQQQNQRRRVGSSNTDRNTRHEQFHVSPSPWCGAKFHDCHWFCYHHGWQRLQKNLLFA